MEGVLPTGFKKLRELWSDSVTDDDLLKMKIVTFPKAVNEGDKDDLTLPYVGFKKHEEKTEIPNTFLAFRCESDCATLPFKETEFIPDLQATFDSDTYTVSEDDPTGTPKRQHMLRAILVEDRIIPLKKRFFCDRTTEKTVTLTITDLLEETTEVKTRTLSCQYPIFEILDLSATHAMNQQNNSWTLIEKFPTTEEIEEGNRAKTYRATLWARKDETIYFSAKFGKGSHMSIKWKINDPKDEGDDCKTTDKPSDMDDPDFDADVAFVDEADKACIFPFRYNDILYYGCTNATKEGDENAYQFCATKIDEDFNAKQVGWCNEFCHVQAPRPEEVEGGSVSEKTVVLQEGGTVVEKKFILPVETTLELKRKFTKPGQYYHIHLEAFNMHDEDDFANLTWTVLCGNPVEPEDWTLEYSPFLEDNHPFNLTLKIATGKVLPTKPTLRFAKVIGEQRLDSNIEISNETSIKFFLHDSEDNPVSDCETVLTGCYETYEFSEMGFGDNLESGDDGSMGTYGTELLISIPSFDKAGSYGFSVQFLNGISSIKYEHATMKPVLENVQLLDPSPTGTGEWVIISVPKWDFNFVEKFAKIEGPVQFKFMYTLPREFNDEKFTAQFTNKKWYLPASAIPYFELDIYKGKLIISV